MRDSIEARAVRRAVAIVGSVDQLAARLTVAPGRIVAWSDGVELVPPRFFSSVVDVLLEQALGEIRADIARSKAEGDAAGERGEAGARGDNDGRAR